MSLTLSHSHTPKSVQISNARVCKTTLEHLEMCFGLTENMIFTSKGFKMIFLAQFGPKWAI